MRADEDGCQMNKVGPGQLCVCQLASRAWKLNDSRGLLVIFLSCRVPESYRDGFAVDQDGRRANSRCASMSVPGVEALRRGDREFAEGCGL